METALAHLNHFCASLPKQPYVDLDPVFSFEEDKTTQLIRAKVSLPSCIDPSLRRTCGKRIWHSERMATKDAAFQAYVKLHRAGLVNDHLLPFHSEDMKASERRTPIILVSGQHNPWIEIGSLWRKARKVYRTIVSIHRPGQLTLDSMKSNVLGLVFCFVASSDFTALSAVNSQSGACVRH